MWCPVGQLWPWCWLLRAAAGNGHGNRNRHPHPHAHASRNTTEPYWLLVIRCMSGLGVAPAQFSTEMALNDLESIGESIVMVENGFVR